MLETYSTGALGFCKLAGHSGNVLISWEGNTVVDVKCGFGDHRTCMYATTCELYNRHPVGFVKPYPASPRSDND